MKKLLIPLIALAIVIFFFYPVLKGHVPFPGDLLVGHYEPYKSNSYSGFGPGSVPHKAQGPDVITQLYPWKYFVTESYKQGEIPFWTPYQFSGSPQLADFQSGALYPGNFIFFVSSFVTSWTIFIFLTPLLTILFMYLFLREVGLSRLPSFFAGVVFAFSSYMVVWMEYGNIGHTFLWLPFLLYCVEKLMKNVSKLWVALFVGGFVMAFLAGYIQGYFYLTATVALYYLGRRILSKTLSWKETIFFFVLIGIPVGLTLFQLFPTLQLFSHSSRGNYTLEQITNLLNPLWYGITVLVPDFFGHPASRNQWIPITYIERVSYFGFLPFLLSLFGILTYWKETRVKIFTLLFVFTFVVTLDLYVTKFLYLLPIPVISTTVPTRLLSLFVFSGSILAAFGLENLLKRDQLKTFAAISVGSVLFIVLLWGVVFLSPQLMKDSAWITAMSVGKRNIILPTLYALSSVGIVILLFLKQWKKYTLLLVTLGIIVVTLFDLFYFFHKVTPFSPREYVFPQTPVMTYLKEHAGINRYWGYGSAAISSNFSTAEKVYSVEGVDALHLDLYSRLLESTKTGVPPEVVSRSDANLTPGYGTGDLSGNKYRKKMMNMLGVKYVLHKNEAISGPNQPDVATFHDDEYRLVWQEGVWQVYENRDVAPRFFLTNQYVVENPDNFFTTFYDESFDEKTTLIVTKDPQLTKGDLTEKRVELLSYTPTSVSFTTRTNKDALLFLSDSSYEGWNVYIDDKKAELLTANYVFRSVVVPQGEHTVRFVYENDLFNKGVLLSGITLGLFLLFLWKVNIKL